MPRPLSPILGQILVQVLATVLAATATLVAERAATGDVLTVCPDGSCDFTSVDDAIAAAEDGDRIEIGPGEYPISQDHDLRERAIELVGIAGKKTPPRLRLTEALFWIAGPHPIALESIEISGDVDGVPTHQFGLDCFGTDAADIRMKGCRFRSLDGWMIDGGDHATFEDCVFERCRIVQEGAFLDAETISLRTCLFDSCTVGDGVSFYRWMIQARDFEAVDTVVRNCAFLFANCEWLRPWTSGTSAVLRNCRFENNTTSYYGLITFWSQSLDVLVDECVFTDNVNRFDHRVASINTVDTASMMVRNCRFEDPLAPCDGETQAQGPRALGFFGGRNISIQGCDFLGGRGGIALLNQFGLGPVLGMEVRDSRFLDQTSGPACWIPDPDTCPLGTAFSGFHSDTQAATFVDCTICGGGAVPLSGAWIDGGGNCITRDCADLDGDGAADGCNPDPLDHEIHVPGDVATLDEALTLARRGQAIVLAPGDHDVRGLRSLSAADLVVRAEVAIEGPLNTARIHLVEDGNVGLRILSSPGAGVRFQDVDLLLPPTGGFVPSCVGPNLPNLLEGLLIAESSTLSFSGCRIFGAANRTTVAASNSVLALESCRVEGGSIPDSAAAEMSLIYGHLTMDRSSLEGTHLRAEQSTATLSQTAFEGVRHPRGAIEVIDAVAVLDRCDVVDTTIEGADGGAVDAVAGELLVRDSWFRGNRTPASTGAAIRVRSGGELALAESTFCDNQTQDVQTDVEWTDLGGNLVDPEGCARMAGDLDGDGCIGGADLGRLFQRWSVTSPTAADLDRNGIVDSGDLGVLFANWGRCF